MIINVHCVRDSGRPFHTANLYYLRLGDVIHPQVGVTVVRFPLRVPIYLVGRAANRAPDTTVYAPFQFLPPGVVVRRRHTVAQYRLCVIGHDTNTPDTRARSSNLWKAIIFFFPFSICFARVHQRRLLRVVEQDSVQYVAIRASRIQPPIMVILVRGS